MTPLTARLESMRTAVNAELSRWSGEELAGAGGLAAPVEYAAAGAGKRIRPLLVICAWQAARGPGQDAGPHAGGDPAVPAALCRLALGPELVHAGSLAHDDLPCMDDADLRRGRPSVHVQFDEAASVFAGAAPLPLAVRAIRAGAAGLGLDEEASARLIRVLAAGARQMASGQLLDILAEGRRVEFGALQRMHEEKTASLIAASCVMGAVAARAPEKTVNRLRAFGRAIGLAFQTIDDILDVTGSTDRLGKTRGRDEELEKSTVPALLGLAGARALAEKLEREARRALEPLPEADGLREIGRLVLDRAR